MVMPTASGRGSVLVVDDDAAIKHLVERVLSVDYDVRATTSPREALGWLDSGDRFDVVVFDLQMPEMSGALFFAALASRFPEMARRGIVLTGSLDDGALKFLNRTLLPRVSKPFRGAALKSAIAGVLERH